MRNLGNLRLKRFTDIEQIDLGRNFAGLDCLLDVLNLNFFDMHLLLLLGRGGPAEKFVIDQLRHGLVRAAKRALRVFAKP